MRKPHLVKSLALLIALLIGLSLSTQARAELGRLIRQEVRRTASSDSVLVCVYAVGSREVEAPIRSATSARSTSRSDTRGPFGVSHSKLRGVFWPPGGTRT